jgi:hypothetical protein
MCVPKSHIREHSSGAKFGCNRDFVNRVKSYGFFNPAQPFIIQLIHFQLPSILLRLINFLYPHFAAIPICALFKKATARKAYAGWSVITFQPVVGADLTYEAPASLH